MLTRLPDDILLLLCTELLPLDIMSLRQTCKSLLAVTSRKFVWITSINRMCKRDTVFLPSFPTTALEIPQLQAIATGPERWSRLIDSHIKSSHTEPEEKTLKPLKVRKLSTAVPNDSEGIWPSKIFLVPGGRFLLTMTNGTMAIWDLDVPSLEKPLATKRTSSNLSPVMCPYHFIVHPSADEKHIRAIVYSQLGARPFRYHYHVYEISPTSENPSFTLISELDVVSKTYLNFTSVYEDRLVLIHGTVMKMWNFVTDEWATWRVDDPPCQILMLKDSITLVYLGHLAVWDIPKLTPGAQKQGLLAEPSGICHPRYVKSFSVSDTGADASRWCNGLDDFFTGSDQPLWFDFRAPNDEVLVLDRFLFEPNHDTTFTGDDEKLTPQIKLEYPYHGDQGMVITACRPCNGGVYAFWHDELGMYCEGGPASDRSIRRNNVPIFTEPGPEPIAVDESKTTFCPVSGRLCYMLWQEHADPTIHVLDFLGPASSESNVENQCATDDASHLNAGDDATADIATCLTRQF